MTLIWKKREFSFDNTISFLEHFEDCKKMFEEEFKITLDSLDYDFDKLFDLTECSGDDEVIAKYLEMLEGDYILDYNDKADFFIITELDVDKK